MLTIAPTKSNLLTLKRQLAFAEEGFDLLEQKRQLLIQELMRRLARAREVEENVTNALRVAYASLREALLRDGSDNLDRTLLAVAAKPTVAVTGQRLMGLHLPHLAFQGEAFGARFGVGGTSAATDVAMRHFVELLPLLTELAELQNSILRLARDLRKTQRRCNALSKIFIPEYRETCAYIAASLEEREREALVILRMIRDRQTAASLRGSADSSKG
jgi:V/A-type H+-transporting ATPase subunit D